MTLQPSRLKHRKVRKIAGLTMIELMIVVAVLTIIVTIAVPSYRAQALRANRTDALDELLRQAAFQQRQFTINNQFSAVANYTTQRGSYQIQTTIANAGQTYTLSAVPQARQTEDTCGTLQLTSVGEKTATGGDNQRCWAGRGG